MNDAAMLKQYRRQIKKLEAHIKEVNLTLHTFENWFQLLMIQYFDNNLRQQRQIYSTFGNVCLLLKVFL